MTQAEPLVERVQRRADELGALVRSATERADAARLAWTACRERARGLEAKMFDAELIGAPTHWLFADWLRIKNAEDRYLISMREARNGVDLATRSWAVFAGAAAELSLPRRGPLEAHLL